MCAGLSPATEGPVGLGQGLLRADVVPPPRDAPAVDRRPRIEPLDETPRLVRIVPLGEVLRHEAEHRAWVEVERDAGQRAARLVRLFLEQRDSIVAVELDHGVAPDRFEVAD